MLITSFNNCVMLLDILKMMKMFKLLPVKISQHPIVSYTDRALSMIGRPINKVTHHYIQSLKHEIRQGQLTRRDSSPTEDEYAAICILENVSQQCDYEFERARVEAIVRQEVADHMWHFSEQYIVKQMNREICYD